MLANLLKGRMASKDFAQLKTNHLNGQTKAHGLPVTKFTVKIHYCSGLVHHGMGIKSAQCVEYLRFVPTVRAKKNRAFEDAEKRAKTSESKDAKRPRERMSSWISSRLMGMGREVVSFTIAM